MPPSTIFRHKRTKLIFLKSLRPINRRYVIHILGICLLLSMVCIEFISLVPQADAQSHTSPTVDTTCKNVGFSPDGNPFPLCPGPFPTGGNCVWWAWEQWHLLGYDLPLNWGNAADWIVDAERTGLPIGTTPRVGAIAVFPRADGVWAYGTPGHVAFVTSVSDDGLTFNVTYQNYGDPTPMYVGTAYSIPMINQARFQDGQLRFIYFPKMLDSQRFQQLPGIGSNAPQMVLGANKSFTSSASTLTGNRITLGSQAVSSDQEFNADFTGSGYSDLLLYNRQQGRLNVLKLTHGPSQYVSRATARQPSNASDTQVVSLKDATTAVDKWGSSLDVHIGDFDGSGHSEILLYDREVGTIQILSLTPQLTIKKHVILPNWGPDWELYVGRFDGQRSGLVMYKRYAQPDPYATPTDTSSGLQPTATDTPTSTSNEHPTVQPSPTAKPKPTPSPTAKPKPSPTAKPSPTVTPKPSPTVTPKPSPTVTPTVKPSPTTTPKASPTVTPTAKPNLTVTPTVKPSPTASPKPSVTGTPTPKPNKTGTPTVKPSPTGTRDPDAELVYASTMPSPTPTSGHDLSGSASADWEKAGRTANVMVLDFNKDFSVHVQQSYTFWHANWEVYVGRFVNANQDGIFLYDRLAGEGRIMDFDTNLLINHYQESHNLDGNWVVYSGDFMGAGHAQLFMYDPSSGDGQMLAFAPDLTLAKQVPYSNLGTSLVPYVGHFGMSNASVMLYDPQGSQSTFLAFDKALAIAQQTTVQSWGQQWQILVGAFLDRERCLSNGNCSTGDDILVLNRQTGKIEQYVFSFGRKFQVYDNRSQAFVRQGIARSDTHLNQVNTTTFSLLTTLVTHIRDEELY